MELNVRFSPVAMLIAICSQDPSLGKRGGKLVTLGHYVFPSFYPYVLPSRAAWALPHGAYVGARTSPLFWCALSHTQHGPKHTYVFVNVPATVVHDRSIHQDGPIEYNGRDWIGMSVHEGQ